MIALIIHGGAWNIPDILLEGHRAGVARALEIGWNILSSGGSAVDAVEHAVKSMEDDGTFDAGRGSHLNANGDVELDASIMDGTTFRCGAVGAVHRIKNPISLSRKIMDDSEHILLVGEGAERFAHEHGVQLCNPAELRCSREIDLWNSIRMKEDFQTKQPFQNQPSDTVGAVALDRTGKICVGTSTGGTLNKHPGRVGDSPLIGCGTFADSAVGGISTTGWGEGMIKVVMAKTVIDLMEMNGGDPRSAAEKGIEHLKRKVDGHGGVIVLNTRGQFGISYNTPRMARAYRSSAMDAPVVQI
ncbi:MAG: isoaspartyl peptidase/L-asparaginase [Ignavibacteria bacterium]|nr:isoaspartyl peptidase/L-asparaginase [Ignavibacteria bacterium]